MGFHTRVRKINRKERRVRVLVLGLDNAGKTTFVRNILGEDVHAVSPTFGFDIRTWQHRGLIVNLWDIGGQRSLRPFWSNYFEDTHALLWVVDASDAARISACRDVLHELLDEQPLKGAPLLVVANKQDAGALTPDAVAAALNLESLKTHDYAVMPASARTDRAGCLAAMDWLLDRRVA